MPVLKDVACITCGTVREVMLDGAATVADVYCAECDNKRLHRSICSGGCKRRWRYMDLGGIDHSGYVEHLGVKAGIPKPEAVDTPDESKSATPITHHVTGKAIHDDPTFSADARQDRRERRTYKQRRARGKAPLHFTAKAG